MRLHRVFASSCLLGAALATACTGEEPTPCTGAACQTQTPGTVRVELVVEPQTTILTGTVAEIPVRLEGSIRGGGAAPEPLDLTITAEDLPANVTAEPAKLTTTEGKLRIAALASARHTGTKIRLKLTDAKNRYEGDTTLLVFVRDKTGAFDNSFGESGKVELPGGVGGTALAGIVVGADAIFAGGSSEKNFVVSRLALADGKLDTGFGTNGIGVGNLRTDDGSDEIAEALAISPKGQPFVAGYGIPTTPGTEYQVGRFDSKGAIDKSFNGTGFFASRYTGGSVPPDKIVELSLRGLAVQPKDGKPVFGGVALENLLYPSFTSHVVVARLTEEGKLDNAFGGGDGWSDRVSLSTESEVCNAVMVDARDDIYCAGSTQSPTGAPPKNMFVWRVKPDGSGDATYGTNGVAKIAFAPTAVQGEVQSIHDFEGKAVVVGISNGRGAVLRLDAVTGLGDPTFNGGQPVALDAFGPIADTSVIRSAIDKNGAVTVVMTSGVNNEIAVTRVLADGKVDTRMGDAGLVTVKLPSKGVIGRARVAVQPDGRILVGTTLEGKGLVVYRLWGT